MKKQVIIYIFILSSTVASAQLYEIGIFAGGSNYIGDIGPTTYIFPNMPAVGGVAKFNFTPRITFRGTLIYTQLRSKDSKSNNAFREERGLSFVNNIIDASAGIEFNFFKYSLSKVGYSQTPYIIAQAGFVNYAAITDFDNTNNTVTNKRVTSIVPSFGLGYKTRLAENIGIALETSFRYTLKDNIDYNNHDIDLARYNFGNSNSDDWYVFTGITVVYAFGRKGCYKNNFF